MEPASLNTIWEPYLKQLIHSDNSIEIFKILTRIDRKIDSLADEILNSPKTLTLLQESLEGISSIAVIDPRIKTLCLSIINSLNTHQPHLITLPTELTPTVSLKSASSESRQLILDLKSLLTKLSINPGNLRSFNDILAKGLVQITEPDFRQIFLKDVATLLDKMHTWNCFDDDERYSETVHLVNFVISYTELKIPFYLVIGLLNTKSNDILWKYALCNASLDYLLPFETMQRDVVTIQSILETDPLCKLAFMNYLCSLMKDYTQHLPHRTKSYLNLLNFYDFLRKRKVNLAIMEMDSLLNEVIPVQFKRGPVFLRKYQLELLIKNVQFDEQKHTSLSRKQFRLMIKYCYHIHQEDLQHIPLNDAVSLLELARFFGDKFLQNGMEQRIVLCLKALPKNTFGLLTQEGFHVFIETLVKLVKLNLVSGKKFYIPLWPPVPQMGSDLENEMLFHEHSIESFAMYMRQLGLMHWLLSNFMPEERDHAEYTVLRAINSYIEYQLLDVFSAQNRSKIDGKKTARLLHCIQSEMEKPYQFALDYELRAKLKPINPPTNPPKKSEEKMRLNVVKYSHGDLTTLFGLIRNLPIGEIIFSKNSLSPLEAALIGEFFPGVNIIYQEVSNGSN